ncbi:MAG: carotenoid biosynthesis protein [Verrucomicrobia bacterium]|nr:carotenoid biosynthesis protein [Verrucomicrobiota bacterium]
MRGDTERIEVIVPEVEFWQKPVFITFLLVWLANVIISGFGIKLPADGLWVEGLLPVTALATTLLSQRRVLPWQNILAMAAIIGVFGYSVMAVCVRTGLPFGPLVFLDAEANPLFDAVPWWIPAVWVVLLVNARGVAFSAADCHSGLEHQQAPGSRGAILSAAGGLGLADHLAGDFQLG